MSSSLKEYINHINTVCKNSLKEDADTVDIPLTILKIPLHTHQKGVIKRMETLERELMNGTTTGERVFSNYGILGDSVGVGKSLMVLGHISRMNEIPPLVYENTIHQSSSSNFFSIKTKTICDLSEAGCLLVIPHTLFRQWSEYIQDQTTLTNFCVARLSQITEDSFIETIYNSQVVLVSNTLIKSFLHVSSRNDIRWKRIFIDEADTIHLPGINFHDLLKTRFTWFITASWLNMLYLNNNLYFDRTRVIELLENPEVSLDVKSYFKTRGKLNGYYFMECFRIKSYYFLREILSSSHPSRSQVVLKCSEDYIKKSITLPELIKLTILCRTPISHSIIRDVISPAVQQMLHAGDTEGALAELGVKGSGTKELIETVTANLKRELLRLERTYEFKESLEYSSAHSKEVALQTLKVKIDSTKDSIQSIQIRIENLGKSACPICFDEAENYLITPCCSQAFCPTCLLQSISVKPICPLCRSPVHASKCTKLLTGDLSANTIVEEKHPLPNKHDALLQILKENPTGKFLVFSRYDNPFETIGSSLELLGMKVRHLKGNKDAIKSTLEKFESGKIQVLLLNSQFAGAGLNITAATHVILLHAMTHEEEKQILGRAYRVGRVGPLNFIKLLHENEENYAEA
jgi:SNF2 family DNA or RNA helicase